MGQGGYRVTAGSNDCSQDLLPRNVRSRDFEVSAVAAPLFIPNVDVHIHVHVHVHEHEKKGLALT